MMDVALWLIPIIGIPAAITLAVLNPAWLALALPAAIRVLQAIVGFFRWVLSYRIGCAIVAAIVVAILVNHWRQAQDEAAFAVRVAEFEQAQTERDQRAAKSTETLVRKQIADDWMAQQEGKNEVQDFESRLPPDDAFRVGGDVDKLRAIAGAPVSGSAKGVPEAAGKGASADHRVGNRLSRPGRPGAIRPAPRKPAARRQGKV